MQLNEHLKNRFAVEFAELYEREGLEKLDEKFNQFLANQKSADLLDLARLLEEFLVELFDVKKENDELKKNHEELKKIAIARREFVQRHVAKKLSTAPEELDGVRLLADLQISFSGIDDLEKKLAAEILAEKNLEKLELYAAWALYSDKGRKLHKNGALFILPQKVDHQNLLKKCDEKTNRQGFDLTDEGYSLNRAQGEAHYCIFCHKQNKDSCRTGLCEKDSEKLKRDPLGVELAGCPLDEKISEMNLLKSEGFSLAALAVATIDNPMIAGTGHRICNDCMKSCIYQKQDPVDIPQIETRILKDVLALPYGFEIYSLLTRWNPLRRDKKIPEKNSGKKVLIAGLGPAGYTLAHYLLNEGCEVVAIDGLKIEPLNPEISGIDEIGNRVKFKPIKFLDEIYEPLSSRSIGGFGGVAEYGITVRWNKNFLKVIRLLLERRKNFRMFGGIRFGSSITEKIAFETYGFDHIALCIGAGRPNIINIENNFAKGIKMASDFLMSLQLTGAFRENLFTNLQIRMPIVVIGGGLTAIDTACEAQAYYKIQIKKFARYVEEIGKENFFAKLNAEEKNIAEEFLRDAKLENLPPVKILYRKKLQDSPAYRLNHQELEKAFGEGVEFVENITPKKAQLDEFGAVKSLLCEGEKTFDCKTILVAAGTSPNISPVVEDGFDIPLAGKHPKALDGYSFITKIDAETKKSVSFFGDLHPIFEGNVVKAMASAKIGSEEILKSLTIRLRSSSYAGQAKYRSLPDDFLVRIEKIDRLSDHVVEVFVKAPLLARVTEVGQIFRLQNYHAFAKESDGRLLAMEGVAVTALSIDRENGIISGIVVETGGSTSLIKNFKAGEPCVFMGPSGKPTEIPKNETVVFVGGGRGNQPLTALAEAFSANGCRVIFFAGYRKNSYVVREDKMRKACAKLIISIEDEPAQSGRFQGSVIDALATYHLPLTTKIDRIFAIGNNHLMHEVAKLRFDGKIPALQNATVAIASLNSPMQCMMKGVCSQCLQRRKKDDGSFEYFYSCANQDENMDRLDFLHLHNRCAQNSLAEKAARMLIENA